MRLRTAGPATLPGGPYDRQKSPPAGTVPTRRDQKVPTRGDWGEKITAGNIPAGGELAVSDLSAGREPASDVLR